MKNVRKVSLTFLIFFMLSFNRIVSSTDFPRRDNLDSHAIANDIVTYDDEGLADILGDEGSPLRKIPWEAEIDIFVRNADGNQPLLQALDNAMSDYEFSSLQECLRNHPMRHYNVNSDETFAGTTGFLLSFNERGIEKFKNHSSFSCLSSYFDRYKLSNTNTWVLNMVWAEVTGFKREFAIQRHTDDAIILDYPGDKKIMPVQTNVLYVFVSNDMVGGSLEAWDYDASEQDVMKGPMGIFRPVHKRMAFSRGDAQHQVRSYNTSAKNILRGSLVLEQYNIPQEFLKMVLDFVWKDRNGREMM